MTTTKTNANKPVTLFKSSTTKAPVDPKNISRTGGKFGAGYIKGFAVITAGVEALGHGMWVDDAFASQVGIQLKAAERGIKSRFTHPGMSADSLSKGLGRVFFTELENGKLVGDLHFWKSAKKGPDGDLAEFVIQKALEDPESFGSSISFDRDVEAEDYFYEAHSNPATGSFRSPDEDNVENYPHVRLGNLRFVDIVDDPAANPDGMFHQDSVFEEADELLAYALGLQDTKPESQAFGVDADRMLGFATRFLHTRGLKIVKLNFAEGDESTEDDGSNATDTDTGTKDGVQTSDAAAEDQATEQSADESNADESADESSTADSGVESSDGEDAGETSQGDGAFPNAPEPENDESQGHFSMKALDKYCETFGDKRGLAYFRAGKNFAEATALFAAELSKENKDLKEKLELASQSEVDPLSGKAGDKTVRKGFAAKLNVK